MALGTLSNSSITTATTINSVAGTLLLLLLLLLLLHVGAAAIADVTERLKKNVRNLEAAKNQLR